MLRSAALLALALALPAAEDGPDIRWWLVENAATPEGGRHASALFLWHRTVAPDGTVTSGHLLNWGRVGEHNMVVPLWFDGPGYTVVPPALSGTWRRSDGGRSTWITPLWHTDRDARGHVTDRHIGPWLQGRDWSALPPVWFSGGGRHALVPLWFDGPGWWSVPPALSSSWTRKDGGRDTWITPLIRAGTDREGRLDSLYAGPWLHGQGYRALLPLYGDWRGADGSQSTWITPLFHRTRDAEGRTTSLHAGPYLQGRDWQALPPLWAQGADWWTVPPALVGSWTRDDGGSSTWLTPLYHHQRDAAGAITAQHAGPWWRAGGDQGVAPLWWNWQGEGGRRNLLLPLWYDSPSATVVPPALSWRTRGADGSDSTWITPLYHRDRDAAGNTTGMHLLNWLSTGGSDMLLPLWYRNQEGWGLLPAWLQDGQGWTAPPALSWHRRYGGGADTTWLTPLVHWSHGGDGRLSSLHAGPYVQGRDWQALPPLWAQGAGWWTVPPALAGSWRDDAGGSSTWLTPLYHHERDARGAITAQHAGPWWRSGGDQGVAPLWWSWQGEGGRRNLVPPLWYDSPSATVVPPFLSWQTRGEDGGSSTWITPLYHRRTAADGTVLSEHLGPWVRDSDGRRGRHAVVPLWFDGPGWWTAPAALSGAWTRDDGGSSSWFTPLYHHDRDAAGAITAQHAGPWWRTGGAQGVAPLWWNWQGEGGQRNLVLPLWYDSPSATVVPPALSWRTRDADGGSSTWLTPLYHHTQDATGAITAQHAGPWWRAGGNQGVAPLWWSWQGESGRRNLLLPLWYDSPSATVVPPALSWRTRGADGADSTWITPFYHRDRDAAGNTTGMHLLNWLSTERSDMLLPVWYRNQEGWGLLPAWMQDRQGWTAPPALSWHRRLADGSDTTWLTPLYHQSHDAGGNLASLHAGPYVQGRDWRALPPLWAQGDGWWTVPPALSGSWTRADGGSSTWYTPLYHHDRDRDGATRRRHALTWWEDEHGSGLLPLWWQGRDGTTVIPPLLAARWALAGGGTSTWLGPLGHIGRDAAGRLTDWHLLTMGQAGGVTAVLPLGWFGGVPGAYYGALMPMLFAGPDHLVIAPIWYDVPTASGGRHRGLVPLWFDGPGWWTVPLALAGGRDDGRRRSDWITPFYHRSAVDGRVTSQHLLTWMKTPDVETVAPLWWDWRTAGGGRERVLAPVFWRHEGGDGASETSILPLLASWRSGPALDDGTASWLWPMRIQTTDDGSEFSLLWHMLYQRRRGSSREMQFWPLWWSENRPEEPLSWQFLGGLFGRDVDRSRRTAYSYAAWGLIPWGRTTYGTP